MIDETNSPIAVHASSLAQDACPTNDRSWRDDSRRVRERSIRSRRRATRRGVSLIEALVSILIVGFVLTTTSTALFTVFRAERNLMLQTTTLQPLHDLALRWRADAHEASEVTLRDPPRDQPPLDGGSPESPLAECRIVLRDGTQVTYLAHSDRLERIVENAAENAAENVVERGGAPLHRDAYRLPPRTNARFQVEDGVVRLLVLTLETSDSHSPTAPRRHLRRRLEAAWPQSPPSVPSARRRRLRRRREGMPGESGMRHVAWRSRARRGAVLVAALGCFLVVTLLAAVSTKRLMTCHLAGARRQLQWQAEWLAESGQQRAIARLRSDAQYTGEQWNIAADELGERAATSGGQITITVTLDPEDTSRRKVAVHARYPVHEVQGVTRVREFLINTADLGDKS